MIAVSFNRPVEKVNRPILMAETRSKGLNRVIAAAVVNRQFCEMLLRDPHEALQKGYLGETFTLTPEEVSLIASIHADTLPELARQMYVSHVMTE